MEVAHNFRVIFIAVLWTAVTAYVWEISLTTTGHFYSSSRDKVFIRIDGTTGSETTTIKDTSYLIGVTETYIGYIHIAENVGDLTKLIMGGENGADALVTEKVSLKCVTGYCRWTFQWPTSDGCFIKPSTGHFTCQFPAPTKVIVPTTNKWKNGIALKSLPVPHARYDVTARGISLPDMTQYGTSSISDCALLAFSSQSEGFSFSRSSNMCTVFSLITVGQRIVPDAGFDVYMFDP